MEDQMNQSVLAQTFISIKNISPFVFCILDINEEWAHPHILRVCFTFRDALIWQEKIHKWRFASTTILSLGLFWIIILTLYPHIHSTLRFLWCSLCWCADNGLASVTLWLFLEHGMISYWGFPTPLPLPATASPTRVHSLLFCFIEHCAQMQPPQKGPPWPTHLKERAGIPWWSSG